MGYLDDMMGKLGGKDGKDGGVASVQKLFSSSGGLHGLMTKLEQSGCSQQVQSWIGKGDNKPVSGPQIQKAMDPGQINAMAKQSGMTPEETCDQVAHALPDMVDHATPEGKMPKQDPFAKGMDSVKQLLHI